MYQAELAGREFAAERRGVVVTDSNSLVSDSTTVSLTSKQIKDEFIQVVKIPRRPKWTINQKPEELDRNENDAFLKWRRSLALLQENMPDALLTPFEKNIEVWRQLWRVLERSSIIVQVVDARNPLLYYSEDLIAYAKELHSSVKNLILLNKADLVDIEVRMLWADYLSGKGIDYAFWSAKCSEEDDVDFKQKEIDPRIRILHADELIQLFEQLSEQLTKEQIGGSQQRSGDRTVVGLVGYPNVGKSSTINALFGRKKTPVAPSPGRTKHFQTLNVTEKICLCDCPGLVFPAFANSKAEMVGAGVLPVDRLVDVVAPVEYIISKIGMQQFLNIYSLPQSCQKSTNHTEKAIQAMSILAVSRGWLKAAGLPDQTKTGRQIIKDYISGKIPHSDLPPGHSLTKDVCPTEVSCGRKDRVVVNEAEDVEVNDTLLESCLDVKVKDTTQLKNRRPDHKFHKKPPRKKGNRGRQFDEEGPVTSMLRVKGQGASVNGLSRAHYV